MKLRALQPSLVLACLAIAPFVSAFGADDARAASSPKPGADPCPLHAVQFSLAATGNTGHIDRYAIGFTLQGKDPVTASLQVPGLDEAMITPVIGADPQGQLLLVHYVVDLPHALGAQSVRVLGLLVHGSSEREVTCGSPQRMLARNPPRAQGRFDDSTLSGNDMMYVRPVTEARIVRTAQATFAASAGQRALGPAVVVVTVGAQGAVLGERIETSSGVDELDRAALAAARQTQFTEPQFDGAPIALDYVLTYAFRR